MTTMQARRNSKLRQAEQASSRVMDSTTAYLLIDRLNNLSMAGQQFAEELERPLLQCFWKNSVVCVRHRSTIAKHNLAV